jgi:hypothetical protein
MHYTEVDAGLQQASSRRLVAVYLHSGICHRFTPTNLALKHAWKVHASVCKTEIAGLAISQPWSDSTCFCIAQCTSSPPLSCGQKLDPSTAERDVDQRRNSLKSTNITFHRTIIMHNNKMRVEAANASLKLYWRTLPSADNSLGSDYKVEILLDTAVSYRGAALHTWHTEFIS